MIKARQFNDQLNQNTQKTYTTWRLMDFFVVLNSSKKIRHITKSQTTVFPKNNVPVPET